MCLQASVLSDEDEKKNLKNAIKVGLMLSAPSDGRRMDGRDVCV